MPNTITDTAELVGVIETIRVMPTFFLDTFFNPARTIYSTKEEIVFDEVLKGLPVMAPFVSPLVAARPQKRRGFTAKSFRPAYVKPKHFVKPGDFVKRLPGENLLGELSREERMNRTRVDILQYQKEQIYARLEWMAMKAVVNGAVTISGEDYPSVLVDFGRAGGNTITLSGGNLWSSVNADIAGILEDWSLQILDLTGRAGTDVVMPPEVWKNFRNNTNVKAQADLLRGIASVPTLSPRPPMTDADFKGKWGEFNIWVYTGKFVDQDGTSSRALLAAEVIMVAAPDASGSGGVEGIRAFGAIEDMDAQLQAIDIFPKNWEESDPSGEQLMSQSAPLMIPGRPNAVIKATVQ